MRSLRPHTPSAAAIASIGFTARYYPDLFRQSIPAFFRHVPEQSSIYTFASFIFDTADNFVSGGIKSAWCSKGVSVGEFIWALSFRDRTFAMRDESFVALLDAWQTFANCTKEGHFYRAHRTTSSCPGRTRSTIAASIIANRAHISVTFFTFRGLFRCIYIYLSLPINSKKRATQCCCACLCEMRVSANVASHSHFHIVV